MMLFYAGSPKGVMLSHHNIVSSMLAFTAVNAANSNDVYMAFLPLAHVLELCAGVYRYFCHVILKSTHY